MDLNPAPLANQTSHLMRKSMVNAKGTHKRRRKMTWQLGYLGKDMVATILSYVNRPLILYQWYWYLFSLSAFGTCYMQFSSCLVTFPFILAWESSVHSLKKQCRCHVSGDSSLPTWDWASYPSPPTGIPEIH